MVGFLLFIWVSILDIEKGGFKVFLNFRSWSSNFRVKRIYEREYLFGNFMFVDLLDVLNLCLLIIEEVW